MYLRKYVRVCISRYICTSMHMFVYTYLYEQINMAPCPLYAHAHAHAHAHLYNDLCRLVTALSSSVFHLIHYSEFCLSPWFFLSASILKFLTSLCNRQCFYVNILPHKLFIVCLSKVSLVSYPFIY